jgi:hypothetical protein
MVLEKRVMGFYSLFNAHPILLRASIFYLMKYSIELHVWSLRPIITASRR